jgi:DNA-binding response OmpR family regulator
LNKNILLVEDENRMREIVSDYFRASNFNVYEAIDGQEALEIFDEYNIDLIILDIMMPKIDGWSVCRRIRKKSSVPIIMLTARSEEDDKLLGFELGIDEYVVKPFSPKVLIAQSTNLLKRVEGSLGKENHLISFPGLEINKAAHTLKINDSFIDLSNKEFQLLLYLVENPGIVLSRENILNVVWGYDYFGDDRVVDTHIKKIRKKLGQYSIYIHTIIRAGYKFEVI